MAKKKKSRVKVKPADEFDAGAAERTRRPDAAETDHGGASATPSQRPPAADEGSSEVETLRKDLEEAKDQLLRARAEQQNIRKRGAQEITDVRRYANTEIIKSLLDVVDDFERTLEHAVGAEVETLRQGVQLIYDNLLKVLKDHRVEVIDPANDAFDPRYHEAMLQQPTNDREPGQVIQVVQRGYRLDDRVLRPAKVIIASRPEGAATPGSVEPREADAPISETLQE